MSNIQTLIDSYSTESFASSKKTLESLAQISPEEEDRRIAAVKEKLKGNFFKVMGAYGFCSGVTVGMSHSLSDLDRFGSQMFAALLITIGTQIPEVINNTTIKPFSDEVITYSEDDGSYSLTLTSLHALGQFPTQERIVTPQTSFPMEFEEGYHFMNGIRVLDFGTNGAVVYDGFNKKFIEGRLDCEKGDYIQALIRNTGRGLNFVDYNPAVREAEVFFEIGQNVFPTGDYFMKTSGRSPKQAIEDLKLSSRV